MLFGIHGNKLVLERQFRYPIDDYVYELPAGLIEKGESLTEAAKREAFEETVEQIKEQYAAADRSGTVRELARSMGNFEAVKNRLSYRLVGREGNEELLRESPHKNFLDLAAVLELYIDAGEDGAYSIPVRNHVIGSMNAS